jgi:hypothetical protein
MEPITKKTQFYYATSMPRVHDVKSPCQWLNKCESGKCPSLVKLNGNFYCALPKQNHS